MGGTGGILKKVRKSQKKNCSIIGAFSAELFKEKKNSAIVDLFVKLCMVLFGEVAAWKVFN